MLTETSFVLEGKAFIDDMCDMSTDRARVAVTNDDGHLSMTITVMRRSIRVTLTPKAIRLIVGELPDRIARPLRKSQAATILAALRFYQTHGGALDADIQQFIAYHDIKPLTADGVDELAELLSKGDDLLVMSYGG